MTLTAITKDLSVFCPSLEIDQGSDRESVLERIRIKQKGGSLYCPHCYRKTEQFLPVRFRGTITKRVHFAHESNGKTSSPCIEAYGESDKHLFAKIAIADSLKQQPNIQEFSVDRQYVFFVEREGRRKPDILVTYTGGALEAHEIQVSPISLEELQQRTSDLKLMGIPRVVWYLYGRNYNSDIRQYLHTHGVTFYRLTFESDEFYRPRWSLGKPPDSGKKSKPYTKQSDRCTTFKGAPTKYQIGDRVTNTLGWHGQVKRIDVDKYSHPYYWVHWKERETHEDKYVQKYPQCGHLEDQIWKG